MVQASTIFCSIALIVASVSVLQSAIVAEPSLGLGLEVFGRVGPGGDCLATLTGFQDCAQEVVSSMATFQVQLVGPECCRALAEADNKCWPKALPVNPFYPPLLKNHCSTQLRLAPSLP